jgi:hypothetical protein
MSARRICTVEIHEISALPIIAGVCSLHLQEKTEMPLKTWTGP